ncbi:MAG: ParB/RepB/Spo0J family partition protein [Pseudomonadota bacterium]
MVDFNAEGCHQGDAPPDPMKGDRFDPSSAKIGVTGVSSCHPKGIPNRDKEKTPLSDAPTSALDHTSKSSQQISIAEIRTDGGTQPRCNMSEELVKEYAEAMENGKEFPPVTLFWDGADYWLADGFHRLFAANELGKADIAADVVPGSQRDAILHSVGANAQHGLRRTNSDKRRAVVTLLEDPEWSQWSDRQIARYCAVSNNLVSRIRKSHCDISTVIQGRMYRTRHGSVAKMKTDNIGKSTPEENLTDIPEFLDRRTVSADRVEANISQPIQEMMPESDGDKEQLSDAVVALVSVMDAFMELLDRIAPDQVRRHLLPHLATLRRSNLWSSLDASGLGGEADFTAEVLLLEQLKQECDDLPLSEAQV